MRNLLLAYFRRIFVMLVFPVALAFALATTASAQQSPTGPPPSESESARIRAERDMAAREWALRNMGKVKRVDVNVAPPQVLLGKVKEDYVGIQVANNEMLKMLSAGKELDYKLITDTAAEIKKRAGRLKSYLVTLQLVKDNKDRKKNLDELELVEIRASLLSLDASIFSLIESPVFKDFGKIVDLDNSEKARNDLDNIIELSERIKRSVDRSGKAARASR
jgi:hypothetical protein